MLKTLHNIDPVASLQVPGSKLLCFQQVTGLRVALMPVEVPPLPRVTASRLLAARALAAARSSWLHGGAKIFDEILYL